MKRKIGLHLRLKNSLTELALHATELSLSFFQCFLVLQDTKRLIEPTQDDCAAFLVMRRKHFQELYVHGSYWINLAGLENNGYRALLRELTLARALEFTHLILHPGSAKGAQEKSQGIDALARALNRAMKHEREIVFVLENTAHGNLCVGSDITDFRVLLEKVDQPERLRFCIDTAHAFAYGYEVTTSDGLQSFIDLLADTVGLERIVLIHLNDSCERRGARIDRHGTVGEGVMGSQALRTFVLHESLRHIPVLMEPPLIDKAGEHALLTMVQEWHNAQGE
jgi:deoxyribonuclease-4